MNLTFGFAYFTDPNFTAEYLYTTMVSDIRQTCPLNTLGHRLAKSRTPVYRYTLTERPSSPVSIESIYTRTFLRFYLLILYLIYYYIYDIELTWKILRKYILNIAFQMFQNILCISFLMYELNFCYVRCRVTF